MTELEKMKTFHAIEEIKSAPSWMQNSILVQMCRLDKTGHTERLARTLASHKMPIDEIVPCLMDIMQDTLVEIEADGESYVPRQGN